MQKKPKYKIVLIGYNRIGYSILRAVRKMKKKAFVIDFNPEVIRLLMNMKIPCLYGDIGDEDIMERINFKEAEIIISTVPDKSDNILLLNKIKKTGSNAITFLTARNVDDALELYDRGCDYVILPQLLGGEHAAVLIQDLTTDITKMFKHKTTHIKELKHRKNIGHGGVHSFSRKG